MYDGSLRSRSGLGAIARGIIMWEFRTGALEPNDLMLNFISAASWPPDLKDFIENALKIIPLLQY